MLNCEDCGATFKTIQGLISHRRYRHPSDEPPKEPQSNDALATKDDLTRLEQEIHAVFLDTLGQAMDAVRQSAGDLREAIQESVQTNELLKAEIAQLNAQHQPGLCRQSDCQHCLDARNVVRLDILNKVEDRVPGTRESLAHWELMHSTINITE